MPQEARRDVAGLVIVGASVGGLAAAVMAADRGHRAVVLERTRDLGGGAINEPESIAAGGTRFQRIAGVHDSAEALARDILAATRHHVEADVVQALATESTALVEWLADRIGQNLEVARQTPEGHSTPRLHAPVELGGASLIDALRKVASKHPRVAVRVLHTVEDLLRDDTGAVIGVRARSGRRNPEPVYGPVLLACGGFAADDAQVQAHCPALVDLPYHGFAGATGEGLRLGLACGGQLRRGAAGHATAFLALPGGLVVTSEVAHRGGILVNQAGKRFVDETGENLHVARGVRAQPGRVAYLLFDDRIASIVRDLDPFFARVVLPRASRHAATLADLAKQFEIDAAALGRTVETYGANLEIGGDPFGREGGSELEPSFHAIRVTAARRRTLGGLGIDASARVLDAAGRPIVGLYACGGAAAGIAGEGTEGVLPGTTALAALGLARIAAQHATPAPEPAHP